MCLPVVQHLIAYLPVEANGYELRVIHLPLKMACTSAFHLYLDDENTSSGAETLSLAKGLCPSSGASNDVQMQEGVPTKSTCESPVFLLEKKTSPHPISSKQLAKPPLICLSSTRKHSFLYPSVCATLLMWSLGAVRRDCLFFIKNTIYTESNLILHLNFSISVCKMDDISRPPGEGRQILLPSPGRRLMCAASDSGRFVCREGETMLLLIDATLPHCYALQLILTTLATSKKRCAQKSEERSHLNFKYALDGFKTNFFAKTFVNKMRHNLTEDIKSEGYLQLKIGKSSLMLNSAEDWQLSSEAMTCHKAVESPVSCLLAYVASGIDSLSLICRTENAEDSHGDRELFQNLLHLLACGVGLSCGFVSSEFIQDQPGNLEVKRMMFAGYHICHERIEPSHQRHLQLPLIRNDQWQLRQAGRVPQAQCKQLFGQRTAMVLEPIFCSFLPNGGLSFIIWHLKSFRGFPNRECVAQRSRETLSRDGPTMVPRNKDLYIVVLHLHDFIRKSELSANCLVLVLSLGYYDFTFPIQPFFMEMTTRPFPKGLDAHFQSTGRMVNYDYAGHHYLESERHLFNMTRLSKEPAKFCMFSKGQKDLFRSRSLAPLNHVEKTTAQSSQRVWARLVWSGLTSGSSLLIPEQLIVSCVADNVKNLFGFNQQLIEVQVHSKTGKKPAEGRIESLQVLSEH
ncbi:hypothetical protein IHE44_0011177 [Lamprotornis superbus]|uniref:Uncharacterized protein n=1 Tax=Lamprotornis superbus TaxID=245042 RepID=A0A835NTA1_9PASS|nr:hypothetical protein IHE44_0011177 [Lamprotornis superbus]